MEENEILRAALAPGEECLSVEQLGQYSGGALGAAEQAAAARHIGRCLSCQAELALLQAVTSTDIRSEEAEIVRDGVARLVRATESLPAGRAEPSTRRRLFGLGTLPLAAMAAVLLIGVATGSFFLLARRAPQLPGSVTTGGEVTRSLAVTVRGPVGDRIESPQRLEWVGVDRAVRYRVRLLEVDRHEVWSTSTSAPGVDLPPAVRASITPGRTLLWDVTAYDAAGAVIAESGMQSFRVAPR
jgi:hypothetical protein